MLYGASAYAQELEEVIVTAQKREQSLMEVSTSVTAMSAEDLRLVLSAGADLRSLASRFPSMYAEGSNGRLAPRLYLRGVGNVDFDLNASQPISLVYDEVVFENPVTKSFPIFDIDRVEVLRGPQGTLFGRNTTGGIVKLDSKQPTERPAADLSIGLGQFGGRFVNTAFSGPLSETLLGRVAFMYSARSDWVDNVAPGHMEKDALGAFQDIAARVRLDWETTDQVRLLLTLYGRDLRDCTPTLFFANAIRKGTNSLRDDFERDEVYFDAGRDQVQYSTQVGVTVKAEFHFDAADLIWVAGMHTVLDELSRGDIDGGFGSVFGGVLPSGPAPGIPFDAQTADGLSDHIQLSNEVRLEGSVNDRQWRLGLYLFDEDLTIETFNFDTVFESGRQNGHVRQIQETNAWAVFGTMEVYKANGVTVSGGLRYSSDSKDFVAQRFESPLSFLGVGPIGPLSEQPEDSVVTGDVQAQYSVDDETNVFVRLARGHRAPSLQGRLLFQDEISVGDTEVSHSIEAGLRGLYLDRRMRLSATAFMYRVTDFQITKIGGSGNISELVSIDTLHGNGIEAELEFLINVNMLINFGLSYNGTEIQDSELTVNGCGSASLLSGCTVTDPIQPNGEYSVDGNSLYNSPKWIGNTTIHYSRPLGTGTLNVSTDWSYRSFVRFTLYESIEYSDDGMLEGGLRIGYSPRGDRHQFWIYVRNILDTQSMVGSIDFNNLTAMVNPPRMWGFEWRTIR